MNRYLLYASYIGTQFRGVQKIFNHKEPYTMTDPTTIQGSLEIALKRLKPVNEICVIPSSRTDTGVHAIQSTFQVDLLSRNADPYEPTWLTTKLNKYFNAHNICIRILKTVNVPNNFHCRFNAKSRTYMYRLAFIKDPNFKQHNNIHLCYIPIEEYRRCHYLWDDDFNWDNVNEAVKLFRGYHDFRTFMGRASHYPRKMTRRNLNIELKKGNPSIYTLSDCNINEQVNNYDYWNIIFKSEGFLYNQVRRIVGTLIAVGQNKVSPKEVQCMLQIPSHLSWNPKVIPAPSHGLYLWQVEYSSHDLKSFK